MAFRAQLWSILGALALLYTCGGSLLFMQSAGQVAKTPVAGSSGLSQADAQAAHDAGVALGGGLGITFFACTGLPFIALFALLANANRRGLRQERQHQEQLTAQQAQFNAMQQSAMAHTAQAQMQYAQMTQAQNQANPSLIAGPRSTQEIRPQLEAAKALIEAKKYKEARALLQAVDHPKAKEWLARLDTLKV